jgi:methyl-accepting chemotaxis protein
MAEQKSQTRHIPLRVRFRTSSDVVQHECDTVTPPLSDPVCHSQPVSPDLPNVSESERHVQQIRELARLEDLLRADLSIDEILQQIVSSIVTCTGFRVLVLRRLDHETRQLIVAASDGLAEEARRVLDASPVSLGTLQHLMRPEFRLSQSYFISHEHLQQYGNNLFTWSKPVHEYEMGTWHPHDLLFIPLYSLRGHQLLATISLDDPVDGKIPTIENIEVAQLFANVAAHAIDNVLLSWERAEERKVLEEAITILCEDVEALQQGNFRHNVRVRHEILNPIADAINAMVGEVGGIIDNMRQVAMAVDDQTCNVQRHTEQLVYDAVQQEAQVKRVSQVISDITGAVNAITEQAAALAKMSLDAADVGLEAQHTVDLTVKGMMSVRDATLNSARAVKALINSGQEINSLVLAPTELASRLHLLALNAAIEATRAGEHGRGFALIAQQLRLLAAGTMESAQKIEGYIRSVQQETSVVSRSIEDATQKIINQTEIVTQASLALDAINTIIEQLPHQVEGICKVAENQSQSSMVAVEALTDIFQTKANITGHMQEMQTSMAHLVEMTNLLRSRMSLLRPRE